MTMIRLIPALMVGLASASAAHAQDEVCSQPMADWQPREAVRKMAEGLGWEVRRIKIDDGCYEVFARDAKGQMIEAAVDPATLAVVKLEVESDHDEPGHDVADKDKIKDQPKE